MTNSNDGEQGAEPHGRPPLGPEDHPDPSVQQSSFPQPPPDQFPPPGQYPPPGQSPPPGQYPPTQPGQYPYLEPKKKRRVWPWLLLGIPLLFAVLIGGCTLLFFNAVRGPVDATNAHVANLDNGDFGAAYDSLCSRIKRDTPRDVWIENETQRIGGEITGYSFTTVEISGDALVTGFIEVDGVSQTAVYNLIEEGDEWRVCN